MAPRDQDISTMQSTLKILEAKVGEQEAKLREYEAKLSTMTCEYEAKLSNMTFVPSEHEVKLQGAADR